jgi:lysyl-tRNA synthetase class I
VSGVSEKLGARAKEIHERAAAVEQVKIYTRDLWEVLKRRVHRLDQPAEVLQFYQLPLSGEVPNPTTQEEWLALAAQVSGGR